MSNLYWLTKREGKHVPLPQDVFQKISIDSTSTESTLKTTSVEIE